MSFKNDPDLNDLITKTVTENYNADPVLPLEPHDFNVVDHKVVIHHGAHQTVLGTQRLERQPNENVSQFDNRVHHAVHGSVNSSLHDTFYTPHNSVQEGWHDVDLKHGDWFEYGEHSNSGGELSPTIHFTPHSSATGVSAGSPHSSAVTHYLQVVR